MNKCLNKVRMFDGNIKTKNKIVNTVLIFLFGILLGVFAKWLDNLSIDNSIWWQNIIDKLDLRNVFSLFGIWLLIGLIISIYSKTPFRASLNVFLFFIGMTVSYHLYTIYFSGFNPSSYMKIWYGIATISPLLAYISWYSKGEGKISFLISTLILVIMMFSSFNFGMFYFDINSAIDLLIFIATIIVLHTKWKNTICSLVIAFIISFIIKCFI